MSDDASAAKPAAEVASAAPPADKAQSADDSNAPTTTEAPDSKTETSAPTAAAEAPSGPVDDTLADVEMKDKPTEEAAEPAAEPEKTEEPVTAAATTEGAAETVAAPAKQQPRRKSTGTADKNKKLNKKASKAKILHLDAVPGNHYFAKLKGFPPWPVVICEESMLPQNMLSTRPVTAARPDGTYREDFADGGKQAANRTYPVMYLHTNEFSWTPNTDLSELDPSSVADLITSKMRKDLQAAHHLAAESHDLEYYKNVLQEFEEQRLAKLEAKKSKEAAKKTPKKASKSTDEDGDVEMDDAVDDAGEKKSKSKKRKAEDDASTPQRSDSVKKPKFKLTGTSTPKAANGVQTPSSSKDSAKPVKVKTKSSKGGDGKKEKEAAAPSEPELTAEEKRLRKEREILFLRHRLQKALLPREGKPVPDEMKQVSDFLAKLETFPDLDVSVIRATKINKVLKAILKLDSIPKEEEFKFKPRSQTLLDKWNALLAASEAAAPAPAATTGTTNGVNGTKGQEETANGIKDEAKAETEKEEAKEESAEHETAKEETAKPKENNQVMEETAAAATEASG